MADTKQTTKLKLVLGADGSIDVVPYQEPDEPEPRPAEDGRYYLSGSNRSVLLAWELHERGIEAYCAKCRAPLKISRAFVSCSTNRQHFNVIA